MIALLVPEISPLDSSSFKSVTNGPKDLQTDMGRCWRHKNLGQYDLLAAKSLAHLSITECYFRQLKTQEESSIFQPIIGRFESIIESF